MNLIGLEAFVSAVDHGSIVGVTRTSSSPSRPCEKNLLGLEAGLHQTLRSTPRDRNLFAASLSDVLVRT